MAHTESAPGFRAENSHLKGVWVRPNCRPSWREGGDWSLLPRDTDTGQPLGKLAIPQGHWKKFHFGNFSLAY